MLRTGNALKSDDGQPLYVGKMTSSSFGKTKKGEKDLRAALEGIWTRCEIGKRITLVTSTIKPVEEAVKKAESNTKCAPEKGLAPSHYVFNRSLPVAFLVSSALLPRLPLCVVRCNNHSHQELNRESVAYPKKAVPCLEHCRLKSLCYLNVAALDAGAVIERWYNRDARSFTSH